jgi:hypothetical protein
MNRTHLIPLSLLMLFATSANAAPTLPVDSIQEAFKAQSIDLSERDVASIRGSLETALAEKCKSGGSLGNSKVGFAAVEIAAALGLNPKVDGTLKERITKSIGSLACVPSGRECGAMVEGCRIPRLDPDWNSYFEKTLGLNSNREFLRLVGEKKFSPVKISWEDIGRYEGSVWGDRISDVGIWVRKVESDPSSAQLALSVRRDQNFRDKVLVVPAEKIKIHLKDGDETREVSLPERLEELELTSKTKDKNVIVSNQFAIVPVPSRTMRTDRSSSAEEGEAPRVAFNFSIFPYGSTNFVITDVIEGSSDAIVGPGNHQLLFANIDGEKAPFTASRAKERKDLLKLEADLKSQGMDVDVQRYYLIQIPLKREVQGIKLSNMGTPPRVFSNVMPLIGAIGAGGALSKSLSIQPQEEGEQYVEDASEAAPQAAAPLRSRGLEKVAIGHGETEGPYSVGSGYAGARAEEPIRVTVVYFVTPVGEVTRKDMETFTKAFESWDDAALWGGSFVTKE